MNYHPIEKRAPANLIVWRTFKGRRTLLFAVALLAVFSFAAVFASQIAPHDPRRTSDESLRPPSGTYPFGTDDLGRDILSGVIHGARVSIAIGVTVAVLSGLIGVLIGLTAGYAGGPIDDLLMRLTELFLIPPRFFLALVIAALFGSTFFTLIIVLSVTYWPTTARLVRAEVMSLKARNFVEAAHAMGASPVRILFRTILPNALPIIITNVVLMVGGVILVEAALEFIGVGDSNYISWGYMLHNGEHFIRDAWWVIFFPALAVSLLVLALNTVGDALNRALDPKARMANLNKPE